MAAPTSTNEVTARKLSASISALWTKIKSTFQTLGNLVTSWGSTPSDTKYPSEKLVKDSLDAKAPNTPSEVTIANGDKIIIADSSDSNKVKRASVAFDGSTTKNFLSKKGTFEEVKESEVAWGGDFHADLSPIEMGMFPQNLIANPPPENIKYERTTDGGETWSVVSLTDSQKKQFCNLTSGVNLPAGPTTTDDNVLPLQRGRVTIALLPFGATEYSDTWCYGQVKRILLYINRSSSPEVAHCVVEVQTGPHFIANDGVWTTLGDYNVTGDGGWNSIPIGDILGGYSSQLSGRRVAIRFTYWVTKKPTSGSGGRISLYSLGILPGTVWKSNANAVAKQKLPVQVENDGTGTVQKSRSLVTARKLKTNLARTADSTFDGGSDQVNIPVTGTLPVANGGTGQTTAIAAQYALLNPKCSELTAALEDDYRFMFASTSPSTSNGVFVGFRKASAVWTYIKGKISSVLGLSESNGVKTFTGNAATATALASGSADRTKLDGIAAGAEVNVQSDWNQATTTADDYIKNKPTLGTAAAKDVPSSGNASTTQVVMGNDSRLTDSRTPTSHTHGNITNAGGITASGVTIDTGDSLVIVDSSETNKLVAKTSVTFDGSTTTKALTQKGTFETFLTSHQSITGKMNTDASNATAPSGSGGDGATATLLNNLTEGTSDIVTTDNGDNVLIATTDNGGTVTNKWYKRKLVKLVPWIIKKLGTQLVYDCGAGSTSGDDFDAALAAFNAGQWVIIHKDNNVYYCVGTFQSSLRFRKLSNSGTGISVSTLNWTRESEPTSLTQIDASLSGHTHSQYLTASDITGKMATDCSNKASGALQNLTSQLTEGTSDFTDNTELFTSYAGNSGFAESGHVNQPYRRKASSMLNYVRDGFAIDRSPANVGTAHKRISLGYGKYSSSNYVGAMTYLVRLFFNYADEGGLQGKGITVLVTYDFRRSGTQKSECRILSDNGVRDAGYNVVLANYVSDSGDNGKLHICIGLVKNSAPTTLVEFNYSYCKIFKVCTIGDWVEDISSDAVGTYNYLVQATDLVSAAVNADMVDGKHIVIGSWAGASNTIYFG